MNKRCYRLVFNRVRGLLMAVAETAVGNGKSPGASSMTGSGKSQTILASGPGRLRYIWFSVWAAMGLVAWSQNAWSQIVASGVAPANQRPTVLTAPNGVPLVNIQTPSAAGVSRNTYSQFDIQRQGAILNNARTNAQTQLGGWVQGNPWLATGSARIILNEVDSGNPSLLHGYVEVAGSRAQVVVANPAGVTCDGCGFINANRATLTTGTPVLDGGALDGFRVQGGAVSITGAGMDAGTTDYTDLIARSISINAGIWAAQLKITAGVNQVDAGNTQATPVQGSGAKPAYGIDVGQLGGMYAGKIMLLGTEAGVGVRNAGEIGAGAGDVTITVDGRLENAGRITATGNTAIVAGGGIENRGTVYAQADATLASHGEIGNSGIVAAQGNLSLSTDGAAGSIHSDKESVLTAGVLGDGTIGETGSLEVVTTGRVALNGQNLSGADQHLTGQSVDLSGSVTSARNLTIESTAGDLDAGDATLLARQKLDVRTSHAVRTDRANLSGEQIELHATDLSNTDGRILQSGSGNLFIELPGELDNTRGTIAANSETLRIAATTLRNDAGAIQHAGNDSLTIQASMLDGTGGSIGSNGLLSLDAQNALLDGATTTARQLQVESATMSNRGGTLQQTGNGPASIEASNEFDNTGGTVLTAGSTTLNMGRFTNRAGVVYASGVEPTNLDIHATGKLDNQGDQGQGGRIAASGRLGVSADAVDNTNGLLNAGTALDVQANHAFINHKGTTAANGDVSVHVGQIDNAEGMIGSVQGSVTMRAAGAFDNASGRLEAGRSVDLSSAGLGNNGGTIAGSGIAIDSQGQSLDNRGGRIVANGTTDTGTLRIDSGVLANDAGLIQARGALAIDTHGQTLSNMDTDAAGGIVGQDTISIAAGVLNNQAGYVGSGGDMSVQSHEVDNTRNGTLASAGRIGVQGATLDNRTGQVQALGDVAVNLDGTLNNVSGLLQSAQTLRVGAAAIDNSETRTGNAGLAGQALGLSAVEIDNHDGAIRADVDAALVATGRIDNTRGQVSAGGTASLADGDPSRRTLAVINTDGTLIAGERLAVDGADLTGDGTLVSDGDLQIALSNDYIHSRTLQAGGDATVQTAGTLANRSGMSAGGALRLQAATIVNESDGTLRADTVNLHATDSHTLTNRGLIDGQETAIDAITLNNLGTGRIYGDHVSIAASTLTNAAEDGSAPVIAARDRLDIGATAIDNREHALIFSAGDLAVGGALDAGRHATGRAATLDNTSATIESLGNADIAVGTIHNADAHFSTVVAAVSSKQVVEYQGAGSPNRYAAGTPDVYVYNDESDHLHTPEGNYESWSRYEYTRSVSETRVATADPGKILAGGVMRIAADTVINDNSRIIAGGTLAGNVGKLENPDPGGERTTADAGTVTSFSRYHRKGRDETGSSVAVYTPPSAIEPISLNMAVYVGNTAPGGTGTQIDGFTHQEAGQSPIQAGQADVRLKSAASITPITQVAALDVGSAGAPGIVVRTGGIDARIPDSSLFRPAPNPAAGYIVETDPAFADYRQWLSSSYLLSALALDPATTQERLGDGFYEQKLLREQVAQLTGRRFLEGYASDEAEYQALMDNGVTFAKAHQLVPGVALTPQQMAALTSDIVWLVEKNVVLPDGRTAKALAPQLYARVADGDLTGSGALISGGDVHFDVRGDAINGGTIAGRNVVSLTAENLRNLGGRITGGDVAVAARNDLDSIGGAIDAVNSLTATAGRDLNVISTVTTRSNAQGSTTNIGRVAALYVSGGDGTLTAVAGRDINLTAASIRNGTANGSAGGSTVLAAGNDINLGTVTESASHRIVWDGKNQRQDSTGTEVGTVIQAQGDIRMQAGADLDARGATIASDQGTAQLLAGHDITLAAADTRQTVDEAHQHKGKSGWFSSKTITTRDILDRTIARGSTVSGNTTDIEAGHDITLVGSNAVSTAGTVLAAQNDIRVKAAVDTTAESHLHDEKTSGLFSGGGIGFTIGTQEQSTAQQATHATASASTVGSTQGDVTVVAGHDYSQTGSDVLAPQGNIDIEAKRVDITEARNSDDSTIETRFKQSGLTVALSSPVIAAVQTARQMKQAASQTTDGRMQALAAANAALSGLDAYQAIQAGQGAIINGKSDQIATGTDAHGNPTSRDASAIDKAGGINVSISLGSSQSKSDTHQSSSTAAGSTVAAGGEVRIRATGAGSDSDLTVHGSDIRAGNDVELQADNRIALLAAQNTDEQHSTNSSSSGSVGVSLGTAGFGVTASAGTGRGNADGSDVTWTNSHVQAGNRLSMQSGSDTTIKGAVASGRQVTADVSGNLAIESLQDTSVYGSRQQSIGGGITMGAGVSGSVNVGSSKANSRYASVTEQSGIQAGDGGFQVEVQGNTDLRGAAVASKDSAAVTGRNRFVTGTLTIADIQNLAHADAQASGFGLSSAMLDQGKYGVTKAALGNLVTRGAESGDSAGMTRSAISLGAVAITDDAAQKEKTGKTVAETIDSLNRDTEHAHRAADKQNAQAMLETATAEQQIKKETFREITVQTDAAYKQMFQTGVKFYRVTCGATQRECMNHPELIKMEVVSSDEAKREGSILAVNGIFNDAARAGQLAYQNAPMNQETLEKPRVITLMHIDQASTTAGEVLVAAYEKMLAPVLGYTIADETYANALEGRGDAATLSLGHSRGTIVQRNAFEIAAGDGYANTRLKAYGVGCAVSHQNYAETASEIIPSPNSDSINFTYMANDPIPVIAAGNPGDAWAALKEFVNVISASNSAHSCYGTGAAGCQTIANPFPGGPTPLNQQPGNVIVYRGGKLVMPVAPEGQQ